MAARPGEELVANIFADVHYYFGPPSAKLPHHRFDKGSYVYIFENAAERKARLEIANHAGTPDQDAFNGSLSKSHIEYSYNHSNLITLTVDFVHSPAASPNSGEWRLPSFDEHNKNKYLYKLHTIDLYFWTQEDALLFLNSVRRVLPHSQVSVLNEPALSSAHPSDMSPVVQKLEKVAISDPSYQQGQTRDSRGAPSFPGPPSAPPPQQNPAISDPSYQQGQSRDSRSAPSFPGPPSSAPPPQQNPAAFAPMAYNPAAPPAPEAIAHREKTPPPEDGVANPLAAVAASDQGVSQYLQSPPQGMGQPQGSYFPGPPQSAGLQSPYHQPLPSAGLQSPYHQPPPSAGLQSPYGHSQIQHPTSFPPPPPQPSGSAGSNQQPYHAPQISQEQYQNAQAPPPQYANYPGSPGFSSPMQSPPPGGYSPYNYAQKPLAATQDYSIHQQVYRPTESEAGTKFHAPKKEPKGKLEERADKAEKKIGGLFKKLEKKYL